MASFWLHCRRLKGVYSIYSIFIALCIRIIVSPCINLSFWLFYVQCCLLLSMMPTEIVGEKMEPERLYDSVNILLSLQVCFVYNFACMFVDIYNSDSNIYIYIYNWYTKFADLLISEQNWRFTCLGASRSSQMVGSKELIEWMSIY